MATLDELEASGAIVRLEVELDVGEQNARLIYATRRAVEWMEDDLAGLESKLGDTISPAEQVELLLSEYVRGVDLIEIIQFRKLQPIGRHVWELKTPDIRLFGWFYRPCIYIISAVADASVVKDLGLYHGYIGQAVHDREVIAFDPPPCVVSQDPKHVL